MPIKFRFRWIPFIATMIAVALGVSLGQWQTRRAAEKQAIEDKLVARQAAQPTDLNATRPLSIDDAEYRRVVVKGTFVSDWPLYLDNRPYNGTAGFYVMMPLKIAGADTHVLVARGWAKRDVADRARLPSIATPSGLVEIEGIAKRNPGRVLELGEPQQLVPRAIVQNLDAGRLAQAANLSLQPFIVEQLTDTQDGLIRDWPRPSSGVDKHRGYAFQWYALAATALIFFLVTGFRRGKK